MHARLSPFRGRVSWRSVTALSLLLLPLAMCLVCAPALARPPEVIDLDQPAPLMARTSSATSATTGTSIYYEDFENGSGGWTVKTSPDPSATQPTYWERRGEGTQYGTGFEAPYFPLGPFAVGTEGYGPFGTVSISNEVVRSGAQAMKLDRTSGEPGTGVSRYMNLEAAGQIVTVRMAANLSGGDVNSLSYWNIIHVGLDDWVDVNVEPSGRLLVVTPGPTNHYTNIYMPRNAWNEYEVRVDLASRTWELWLNQSQVLTGAVSGTSTYIYNVAWGGQFPNTVDVGYFDDFSVSLSGAWWCGIDDCALLNKPPGYGNLWDQRLEKSFGPLSAGVVLDLTHRYDVEWGSDFCTVEISTDGGLTYTTVESFNGITSTGGGFENSTVDLSAYAGKTVLVSLHFVSDVGASDEDGWWDSRDAAWIIARAAVTGFGSDDFLADGGGWNPVVKLPPPAWTAFRLEASPPCVVGDCGLDFGTSWVAYDPATNQVPLLPPTHVREAMICSPEIMLPASYDQLQLDFTSYMNLPAANSLFWRFIVYSSGPGFCSTRRYNGYVYAGTAGWQCARDVPLDLTPLVEPGATSVRILLSLIDLQAHPNFGPAAGPATEGIYLDNVHVIAINTSGPGIPTPDPCAPPHPDVVTVSGQLSSDCGAPLAGVTVDLNHPNGEMLTTTTDAAGMFAFADVPYSADEGVVAIVAPLGFDATTPPEGQVLIALDQDRETAFTLMCHDPQGDARTIGYWKHQANVYLNGRGTAQESVEDIGVTYPVAIFSHFHENQLNSIAVDGVTYMDTGAGAVPLSLEVIHNTLTVNRDGTMLDRAKQQYLGVLLNVASGKLMTYTIVSEDGATASQALQQVAMFLNDGDPSNDEAAKTISDEINNARMLAVGVIDLNIQHIAYRAGLGGVSFRAGPSPFRGGTMIQFRSEKPSPARADVFSASGRHVRTLYDSRSAVGLVELRWNGKDDMGRAVASGVYYIRLRLADKTFQKAVVFLR